jgi:hypothetical protein
MLGSFYVNRFSALAMRSTRYHDAFAAKPVGELGCVGSAASAEK